MSENLTIQQAALEIEDFVRSKQEGGWTPTFRQVNPNGVVWASGFVRVLSHEGFAGGIVVRAEIRLDPVIEDGHAVAWNTHESFDSFTGDEIRLMASLLEPVTA